MKNHITSDLKGPLGVDEVIFLLRHYWGATYDLQLVVRKKRIFLQIMWAYLEQQSFPLDEESYKIHLGEVLEVVNRCGFSTAVRIWLKEPNKKPRLGRAISFELSDSESLKEFLL
tara:strand:- start:3532 stop:3876 length:345 start_codon:yes stop_codon:yes gene_type:complete